MKKHKFGAKFIVIDGIKFQSLKEGSRYKNLKFLEKHGRIFHLHLQVDFPLSPSIYYDYDTRSFTLDKRSGKHGFCIQRKTKYYADFVYIENGKVVIEDSKGTRTDVYKKKANQILKFYGIKIHET